MIEYPEAVNLTLQMNKEILDKTIAEIFLDNYDGLVKQGFMKRTPEEYKGRLVGKKIGSISNRGKYFILKLHPEFYMVIGFETNGTILYHQSDKDLPRYTLRIDFTDGTILTIRIIAWGYVFVEPWEFFENHSYINFFGIPPDNKELTFNKFEELLEKHDKSIKTFYVGQKYIIGIGNGYLQDIFFKAKIHPKRKVSSLSIEERKTLYEEMQSVIKEAIPLGGRASEMDLYGEPGKYQTIMGNYMKDQPCKNCGRLIEKQQIDGSAAYVCVKCQRV